jgi:hypothetical protein
LSKQEIGEIWKRGRGLYLISTDKGLDIINPISRIQTGGILLAKFFI